MHRADDGGHDASNVCLLCSSCHQAHHAGTLMIRGTATELEVRRPAGEGRYADAGAHVGVCAAQATSDGLDAPLREEAEQAVTQLGWKPAIARAAVSSAIAATAPATLERLICEALRRCLSLQRGV
ncbi:MAG: hypothetical protein H7138_24735 [Myxococcales bacterium]|nr:hypothetical protein [Myxococcales bacterium]